MENHNSNNNINNQSFASSSSDEISCYLRQILVSPVGQWDPQIATSEMLPPPQMGRYTDDYDCGDTEDGVELALVDQGQPVPKQQPVLPRSSSKRTRAAQVHNLSEKRRRSKINEKMKALQNLIPNSNKSDKASVLDEAIEYLKQLQLQVQMLTMRNGLNMHPMSLPGGLQPIQLQMSNCGEENTSTHINMTGTLPVNQETSIQGVYNLPSHSVMPNVIDSRNSFGMESSIPAHFAYQLHSSSQEICREDMAQQQLNVNHTEACQPTAVSLPFDAQASGAKDNVSLETSIVGREQSTNISSFTKYAAQLYTFETPTRTRNLSSMQSGRREIDHGTKKKKFRIHLFDDESKIAMNEFLHTSCKGNPQNSKPGSWKCLLIEKLSNSFETAR
ncbi:hypothetical protein ACFE04_022353 [Oxalis oulophora]